MTQQFRAFVSSTFEDLRQHREFVIASLRRSGLVVDPMEEWTAESDEPKRFVEARVVGCDLCVLLVARRRGFVPDGEKESITQLEYRAALKKGVEVLVFLLRDGCSWAPQYSDEESDLELKAWREELEKRHIVSYFQTEPNTVDIGPAVARWVAKKGKIEPNKIVPKGLCSFEAEDSTWYLDLLPGPCDNEGLPDSIQFWKSRIETTDEVIFSIGLIYGPSGSGKSSLLRAGLLPRLSDRVLAFHVDCAAGDVEQRIVDTVEEKLGRDRRADHLPELVAEVQQEKALGPGRKLLIVLDQFEQWLHANGDRMEASELVAGLRQVDGTHMQVLLVVRDDVWMAISRLCEVLAINQDRQRNTWMVDLFSPAHARHVLHLFGHAYRCLSHAPPNATDEELRFLDQAVAELQQDGLVVPVHLSVFADLMRNYSWTTHGLKVAGGATGIGVRFLQESIATRRALPDHRALEKPIRDVLQVLLPSTSTATAGPARTRAELAAACSLSEDSQQFAKLIKILDARLHLITSTEVQRPDGGTSSTKEEEGDRPERHYRLTHDYLVPPLRQWLVDERRKTFRGRAGLLLEQRAAEWQRAKATRLLPTLPEFLFILAGTFPRKVERQQGKMLRAAAKRHLMFWGSLALGLALVVVLMQSYARSARTSVKQREAAVTVQAILNAPPEAVPYAMNNARPLRAFVLPLLRTMLLDQTAEPTYRLRAACALAHFEEVNEEFLCAAIPTAPDNECGNIVAALEDVGQSACDRLGWLEQQADDPVLKVRFALVRLFLGNPRSARRLLELKEDPICRTTFIRLLASWRGSLQRIEECLHSVEDPACRSGLSAAMGNVPLEDLAIDEQRVLARALSDVYRNAPDGASHSAAGWALQQQGIPLPRIEKTSRPRHGFHWFVNLHGMTMVEIEPGTFLMGDAVEHDSGFHEVALSQSFYMCDREVCVDLFEEFLDDADHPDSEKPVDWEGHERRVSPSGDCPVQSVSWLDALLFCNWLSVGEGREPCYVRDSEKETVKTSSGVTLEVEGWQCRFDADGYRLPTEAEWEYACRAGTTTSYACGDDESCLLDYGWFYANSRSRSWPGATKLPNGWGIFDMHGNVFEWCWDRYGEDYYSKGPHEDPLGPTAGPYRVARGAAWRYYGTACRSGRRFADVPTYRLDYFGFRCVCGKVGDNR